MSTGEQTQTASSDQPLSPLTLTPKEELAVIAERLNTHAKTNKVEKCKVRLELAISLINEARIYS